MAYANSWEKQRYSALKMRPRLFVLINAQKRKVWNYWSYNSFSYQKAVQDVLAIEELIAFIELNSALIIERLC